MDTQSAQQISGNGQQRRPTGLPHPPAAPRPSDHSDHAQLADIANLLDLLDGFLCSAGDIADRPGRLPPRHRP